MTEPLNTSGTTMHFEKPTVQFNENGWGPCELSDTFKDVPYQPFSKSDRLGKICDWTNTSNNDKKYQSEWYLRTKNVKLFTILFLAYRKKNEVMYAHNKICGSHFYVSVCRNKKNFPCAILVFFFF